MAVPDIIHGAVGVWQGIDWASLNISGIQSIFEDMPANLQLPCVVIHDKSGDQSWPRIPMQKEYDHEVLMDLYYSQGADLATVDHALKQLIDPVYDAFNQHITLGGLCENSGVTHHDYGGFTYEGVTYLGIRFVLRATEHDQYIYHA
jgi:hypothetical protein